MSTPMPNTFVVGAGPVAVALAGGLRLGGVPVLGLWGRDPDRARAAGGRSGVAAYSSTLPDVLLEATTVILAVRDDAIADVASMLVGTGLVTRSHVFLHCSGATSAEDAFAAVKSQLGGIAVLHPLRAIPDGAAAMRDFGGTVFGIEGDGAGLQRARLLVDALGGNRLELARDQLVAYHTAATVVSNYLVALFDVGAELLGRAGVDREKAVAALLPLAEGTLANLRDKGLPDALTGPIRRGDAATVARHLELLADAADLGAVYRILGRRLVDLARAAGSADESALAAIAELLQPALGS